MNVQEPVRNCVEHDSRQDPSVRDNDADLELPVHKQRFEAGRILRLCNVESELIRGHLDRWRGRHASSSSLSVGLGDYEIDVLNVSEGSQARYCRCRRSKKYCSHQYDRSAPSASSRSSLRTCFLVRGLKWARSTVPHR